MSEIRASGYISKLVLNDGSRIDILPNDIVLFVGPNNAGKSQSLKDIFTLSGAKTHSVVVDDIEISKTAGSLTSLLNDIASSVKYDGYVNYSVLGKSTNIWGDGSSQFTQSPYYGDLRDFFVANLDTAARLTICSAAGNIQRNAPKKHPIHYAAFDPHYRRWLSENFRKAFGVDVTPNILFGASIPLCIGEPVKLSNDFPDEQSRQEAYAATLETYKLVHEQGDGIKSFTGILLYLMLDYYCTYLIDEPESFLHPPQARIMGEIIGQTLNTQQQAFISTHSEEIIKGLLEVCPDRLKIIRITREGDKNYFSILDNEQFKTIWSDPLLKYSNIMSALFHKTVVLCESDSDCRLYSIIDGHLKQQQGKFSETLFIHCGGKHRMAKIAMALKALNVNVKLIPDIDVLNDENVFKGIVEAFSVEWEQIRARYNDVVANLHSENETINRENAKTTINRILDGGTNISLSSKEIKDIKAIIQTSSKWDVLKNGGKAALPAGNASAAFTYIDGVLRKAGIYIVPVGELECFVKEVGGHGPEWANRVLETYPDLNDTVYDSIKDFIRSVEL